MSAIRKAAASRKMLNARCAALLSCALLPMTMPVKAESVDASRARSAEIDAIFANIKATAPGCAIGVAHASDAVILKAFGSADLEHNAPIRTDTVFEAGSASKQFTAVAVLTLVQEGRLALTDDVRKYIPELPNYGSVVTIEDLLHHTSGLRDWGSVAALGGWPRTKKAFEMSDVLDLVSKQKSLNYIPGTQFSYTNTGYNLLAMIVERVSGMSFQTFTSEKIFQPLGMNHTLWRDDFQTVVPNRAIAYAKEGETSRQDMPFENTFGHAGLLTTVDDLLKWLQALNDRRVNPDFVKWMQTPAVLSTGKTTGYGGGLVLEKYRDIQLIYHSGATAGYRSWVGRVPAASLAISLLCNSTDADFDGLAHNIANLYLPAWTPPVLEKVSGHEAARLAGLYVNDRSGMPLRLADENGMLVMTDALGSTNSGGNTPVFKDPSGLLRIGRTSFAVLSQGKQSKDRPVPTGLSAQRTYGAGEDDVVFNKRSSVAINSDQTGLAGRYTSDEAGATFTITSTSQCLRMSIEDRPSVSACLQGAYKDAFLWNGYMVRAVRSGARVNALSFSSTESSVDAVNFGSAGIYELRARRVN
jgi:CubicO group peptidase (beta-lactamase class C family)